MGQMGAVLLKSQQYAGNPSVFRVVTVVHIPGYMGALLQGNLDASALEIVQQDCPRAWSKVSFSQSHHSRSTAQLATHYLGVREVPSIVTNCSPARVEVHLHPALALVLASHQSNHSCKNNRDRADSV